MYRQASAATSLKLNANLRIGFGGGWLRRATRTSLISCIPQGARQLTHEVNLATTWRLACVRLDQDCAAGSKQRRRHVKQRSQESALVGLLPDSASRVDSNRAISPGRFHSQSRYVRVFIQTRAVQSGVQGARLLRAAVVVHTAHDPDAHGGAGRGRPLVDG